MKRVLVISTIALLGLILTACSGPVTSTPAAPATAAPGNTATPAASTAPAPNNTAPPVANLTQTNDQAAVTVDVTPLNLDDATAATLDFEIVLNTHSVDLSYDLMAIAVLRNDSGEEVKPAKWNGPASGGHHVSGILSFSQMKDSGTALTLILRDIAGVPERTFEWKVK